MNFRNFGHMIVVLATFLGLLFPVLSQAMPEKVRVALKTTRGTIILALDAKHAPITTTNFLHYVETGKLEGAEFWRAMKSGPTDGFIASRLSNRPYPPIAHESTKQTGLSHTNGAISMSRFGIGTTTGDFVLCVGDMTYMDAGHDPKGDNQGYAVFGYVVSGMDVVNRILHSRIETHTPEGGWKGQVLSRPVKIISARRLH